MTSEDNEKHRHDFSNELGIIIGFAELALANTAESDPRYAELTEILKAARAALVLLRRVFPLQGEVL